MGSSIAGNLSPVEVAELEATRTHLLTVSSGVPAEKFVFFAAFDGTNNDRNNLRLSGLPHQTNVANLYDQAKAMESAWLKARYYPGVGTGGDNGNWINAGIFPTKAVRHAAELAIEDFAREARVYLRNNPTATPADLSAATVGFSRGTAPEVMFARLLHERGLVLPDGTVVAPPGSVPVSAMVLFDPVHTFIQEDLSLPPSVVGKVMVIAARDELRGEFKLADYSADPRVQLVRVPGNHSGIGGGYDLHGTGAATLEMATAYFQNSNVALGDVPPERRFDPCQPIPTYTELYQVARNGDVLIDELGRPVTEWRELRSRGAVPVGSAAQEPAHGRPDPAAPTAAAHGPQDARNPLNRDHGLYSVLQRRIPDASEDRLVQFTAACHVKGITAENLGDIFLLEKTGAIHFHPSWPPGPAAHVDLKAPMPSPQQAAQQVQAFDQQQAIQQAQQARAHAQEQQFAPGLGGPGLGR